MKRLQVAIAFDQLLNTIFNGYADETLSSRAHRRQHANTFWFYARRFIDFIFLVFFMQKNHCYEAFRSEIERRHLSAEFRMKIGEHDET